MAMEIGALSPSQVSSSVEGPFRYYVVRPDNSMVPLVPADSLPLRFLGVPTQLTHQQLCNENWKYFAHTTESKSQLALQAPAHRSPTPPKYLAPDHNVRAELSGSIPFQARNKLTNPDVPRAPLLPHRTDLCDPVTSSKPLADIIADRYPDDARRLGYPSRARHPSGIEPNPANKEYCTHWIRTNECDFTAVGCKYKHEMPPIDILRKLGFTDSPKWWKQKNVIRAPTWMESRMQEKNEEKVPTWMESRMQEGKDAKTKEQEPPSPKQSALRNLFREISDEGRDNLEGGGLELPREVLERKHRKHNGADELDIPRNSSKDTGFDLIDFGSPTSRRSSTQAGSDTTNDPDAGSESPSRSRAPSPISSISEPCAVTTSDTCAATTLKSCAATESVMSSCAPSPATSSCQTGPDDPNLVEKASSIVPDRHVEAPRSPRSSQKYTRGDAKAATPNSFKKPGLAKSKHAMKADGNTPSASTPKQDGDKEGSQTTVHSKRQIRKPTRSYRRDKNSFRGAFERKRGETPLHP